MCINIAKPSSARVGLRAICICKLFEVHLTCAALLQLLRDATLIGVGNETPHTREQAM